MTSKENATVSPGGAKCASANIVHLVLGQPMNRSINHPEHFATRGQSCLLLRRGSIKLRTADGEIKATIEPTEMQPIFQPQASVGILIGPSSQERQRESLEED